MELNPGPEQNLERLQNTPAQPLQVSVCFEERGI